MRIKHFKLIEYTDYQYINQYNYTIPQLKQLCRHHHLRLGGNKSVIKERLYTSLYRNFSAFKIQSAWRKSLYHKLCMYKQIYADRKPVNSTDFYTLDTLDKLPHVYRFNILEKEHMYCFHIHSFQKLLTKKENPYTRSNITQDIIERFHKHYKLLSLLGLLFSDEIEEITPAQQLTQKILSVFQRIESLGFYIDTEWFHQLTPLKLLKYIKELYDIWTYRANLSPETKRAICPPNGNPFHNVYINNINYLEPDKLKWMTLNIIEQFIKNNASRGDQYLGACYVLQALTLVSQNAADSLPWLYQTVIY
tara:strand:+ start:3008 stop:3928 length:921 start_codon:yes stop_codon:yes gene_type:complete